MEFTVKLMICMRNYSAKIDIDLSRIALKLILIKVEYNHHKK